MKSYPTYPAYKDSGVEWLGRIPEHWEIDSCRHSFTFSKGLTITKENLQENGIPCVNYGEIHSKFGFEVDPLRHSLKCVSDEYLTSDPNAVLRVGDFVFADTSEDLEGAGNFTHLDSAIPTFAGYHTVIARQKKLRNTRFLAYLIDSASFRDQVRKNVKGVKVYSITQGILKSLGLLLPSPTEQKAITDFLDDKTAKIDKAIAQKERLIELLKERKQIIIQNAVTKGLDPNIKMKDSGIEWIGEIPEHWEVVANRTLFRERKEPGRADLPILSVSIHSGVSDSELSDEDNLRGKIRIENKASYKLVQREDVAYNMMRAWQGGIGRVPRDGMVSPAYVVAIPKSRINSCYFEAQYRIPIFIQQMNAASKGITDFRKRLYWEEFKQLLTIIPPLQEQERIVGFIEQRERQLSPCIDSLKQQIQKLREYRATLIDSAVTGKIDIHEHTHNS